MYRSLTVTVMLTALALASSGCRRGTDATSQTTVTSGPYEPLAQAHDAPAIRPAQPSDNDEMVAAFKLETSDYQSRLQVALDGLDRAISNPPPGRHRDEAMQGELVARRDLLKGDLDAIERSTEEDWSTIRVKVESDLNTARGTQVPVPVRR